MKRDSSIPLLSLLIHDRRVFNEVLTRLPICRDLNHRSLQARIALGARAKLPSVIPRLQPYFSILRMKTALEP